MPDERSAGVAGKNTVSEGIIGWRNNNGSINKRIIGTAYCSEIGFKRTVMAIRIGAGGFEHIIVQVFKG
jgi:hypothetical protein